MKAPRLLPEVSTWQVLIMDPKGRWTHLRLDELLANVSRLGVAKHIGLETEFAVSRVLCHEDKSNDQR